MTGLTHSILRQITSHGYQVGVERDYFSVTYTATDDRTGQRFEVTAGSEQETDAALRLAEKIGLRVNLSDALAPPSRKRLTQPLHMTVTVPQ